MTIGRTGRLKPEHIAALVAIVATAYVGLHKLYKDLEPAQPRTPPPGREQLVIKTFPARRHGWPCAYQVILAELVIVGAILVVVFLTSSH